MVSCALRKQPVWTFPSTLSVTQGLSFMMAAWLKPLNWRILQYRSSLDCWLCATLSCQRRRVKVNCAHGPEVAVITEITEYIEVVLIDVSVNMKEIWCTRPSHLTREPWSLRHETLGLSSGPEPPRPSHCVRWDEPSHTSYWPYWTSTTCAREWASLVRSSLITAQQRSLWLGLGLGLVVIMTYLTFLNNTCDN